jgi:hypothetical protein
MGGVGMNGLRIIEPMTAAIACGLGKKVVSECNVKVSCFVLFSTDLIFKRGESLKLPIAKQDLAYYN